MMPSLNANAVAAWILSSVACCIVRPLRHIHFPQAELLRLREHLALPSGEPLPAGFQLVPDFYGGPPLSQALNMGDFGVLGSVSRLRK
eukprot:632727-Pyramimonas_sp.AAC.1